MTVLLWRIAITSMALMFFGDAAWAAGAEAEQAWYFELLPIGVLLAVVAFVLGRLPPVEGVNHTAAFRKRRVMNWLPLGLTYAFLYMGRYNLKVSKFAFENLEGESEGCVVLMSNADFGNIFTANIIHHASCVTGNIWNSVYDSIYARS